MLIPFSMMLLGTQLVITVADGVPKFDIERECRLDSAEAFDPNAGLNETIKKCIADEQQALAELQTQWSKFRNSDKAQCSGETKVGGTPSYVELLTCLEVAKEANESEKQ